MSLINNHLCLLQRDLPLKQKQRTKNVLRLPSGAKKTYEKTKEKAFEINSRNADDLKRIYRIISAGPE